MTRNPLPLPFSPRELERYRLALRPRAPTGQVGPHVWRRRGQSLEFREHVHYTPGTDYRHIDWRASLRWRRPQELEARDLLVRVFEPETQLRLAISIDHRPTMALPAAASKVQVACWIAQAVTTIAAAGGDRVLLHRLFGPPARLTPIQGRNAPAQLLRFVRETRSRPAADADPPELASMARLLVPGAVWLIITDLYFDDLGGPLRQMVARVQRGLRWVILVELDSWPYERAVLLDGDGAYRIHGPRIAEPPPEVGFDEGQAERVAANLARHRQALVEPMDRGGFQHCCWSWDADPAMDPGRFFRSRFFNEPAFKQLFRRQA